MLRRTPLVLINHFLVGCIFGPQNHTTYSRTPASQALVCCYIPGGPHPPTQLKHRPGSVISRNLNLGGRYKCLGGDVNMRKVQIYILKTFQNIKKQKK